MKLDIDIASPILVGGTTTEASELFLNNSALRIHWPSKGDAIEFPATVTLSEWDEFIVWIYCDARYANRQVVQLRAGMRNEYLILERGWNQVVYKVADMESFSEFSLVAADNDVTLLLEMPLFRRFDQTTVISDTISGIKSKVSLSYNVATTLSADLAAASTTIQLADHSYLYPNTRIKIGAEELRLKHEARLYQGPTGSYSSGEVVTALCPTLSATHVGHSADPVCGIILDDVVNSEECETREKGVLSYLHDLTVQIYIEGSSSHKLQELTSDFAADYGKSFKVWVDGDEVTLELVREEFAPGELGELNRKSYYYGVTPPPVMEHSARITSFTVDVVSGVYTDSIERVPTETLIIPDLTVWYDKASSGTFPADLANDRFFCGEAIAEENRTLLLSGGNDVFAVDHDNPYTIYRLGPTPTDVTASEAANYKDPNGYYWQFGGMQKSGAAISTIQRSQNPNDPSQFISFGNLPVAICGSLLMRQSGRLYLFGGGSGSGLGYRYVMWCYETDPTTWYREIGTGDYNILNDGAWLCSGEIINGIPTIYGGINSSGGISNKIQRCESAVHSDLIDPAKWSTPGTLSSNLALSEIAIEQNEIVLLGGATTGIAELTNKIFYGTDPLNLVEQSTQTPPKTLPTNVKGLTYWKNPVNNRGYLAVQSGNYGWGLPQGWYFFESGIKEIEVAV